jgi:hypothetical protein
MGETELAARKAAYEAMAEQAKDAGRTRTVRELAHRRAARLAMELARETGISGWGKLAAAHRQVARTLAYRGRR